MIFKAEVVILIGVLQILDRNSQAVLLFGSCGKPVIKILLLDEANMPFQVEM